MFGFIMWMKNSVDLKKPVDQSGSKLILNFV